LFSGHGLEGYAPITRRQPLGYDLGEFDLVEALEERAISLGHDVFFLQACLVFGGLFLRHLLLFALEGLAALLGLLRLALLFLAAYLLLDLPRGVRGGLLPFHLALDPRSLPSCSLKSLTPPTAS